MTRPRLVVGLGNRFRGDDGAGLEAAARLRASAPAGVEVVEHTGDAAGLLERLAGAAEVVIIDAVRSGAPPGTVTRFPAAGQLGRAAGGGSTHAGGLAEALRLGAGLGRPLPEVEVIGIEAGATGYGEGLSPPVAAAVAAVVAALEREAACTK